MVAPSACSQAAGWEAEAAGSCRHEERKAWLRKAGACAPRPDESGASRALPVMRGSCIARGYCSGAERHALDSPLPRGAAPPPAPRPSPGSRGAPARAPPSCARCAHANEPHAVPLPCPRLTQAARGKSPPRCDNGPPGHQLCLRQSHVHEAVHTPRLEQRGRWRRRHWLRGGALGLRCSPALALPTLGRRWVAPGRRARRTVAGVAAPAPGEAWHVPRALRRLRHHHLDAGVLCGQRGMRVVHTWVWPPTTHSACVPPSPGCRPCAAPQVNRGLATGMQATHPKRSPWP